MTENKYQAHLIKVLYQMFPGCIVLINDSARMQGIPDLTVLWERCWAMLEVKAYHGAPHRPNQDYYVDLANGMSFGAFIFPENEEEVLSALQRSFEAFR